MPLAGISRRLTAMLIADCVANNMVRPAAAKRVNASSLRIARRSERMTMKANSMASARHSATPNSSPATAKTKSVWLSGSRRFTVPSPGPLPNQPPRMKLSVAMSML